MTTVTLSLISHTNVGKTTLARTLLRRDVGEVHDRAHVTEVSEAYPLLETENARLRLWDTPGFGDTRRLMRRLRHEQDPLGWFLHQLWDRVVDRPLWCSQEAVRNIKEEADVVLYLVNAAEEPAAAGYVSMELDLLEWMDRPVLVVLNQVGEDSRDLEQEWRSFVAERAIVRGVLPLDAFSRSWTEEGVLLEAVRELLDGEKQAAMRALTAAWNDRNLAVFRDCCREMAELLARISSDRETAEAPAAKPRERGTVERLAGALKFGAIDKRKAMAALDRRLDEEIRSLMSRMIDAHGIDGESAARIEQRVQDFQVRGRAAFDGRSGAVAGAVVSGVLGGLAADVLAGGLSLGGGMIAGGILGALGGSALARGYRWIGGDEEPSVGWTPEFLTELTRQLVLRYLAVAHFGRGRGEYRDLEQPASWSAAVEHALAPHRAALRDSWNTAGDLPFVRRVARLTEVLDSVARTVLRETHPRAATLLES